MITLDDFEIDVVTSEQWTREADITEEPVEDGVDITDHIRLKQLVVTVEGVVSDTPIGTLADRRSTASLPTEEFAALLDDIYRNKRLVTYGGAKRGASNLALKAYTLPEDPQTGDSLPFSLTLKQIRVVEVKRTRVKVAIPRVKSKAKRGKQGTTTDTASENIADALGPDPDLLTNQGRSDFSIMSGIKGKWF